MAQQSKAKEFFGCLTMQNRHEIPISRNIIGHFLNDHSLESSAVDSTLESPFKLILSGRCQVCLLTVTFTLYSSVIEPIHIHIQIK